MNRVDFQKMADIRAVEARFHLEARMYSGTYYLAGYAVECGFKACIARMVKRHEFPGKDFIRGAYTHDFEQ